MVDKVARVWAYVACDFNPNNIKLAYGASALREKAGGHFSALGVSLDDVRLAMACSPLKHFLKQQFNLEFSRTQAPRELLSDPKVHPCTFTHAWQVCIERRLAVPHDFDDRDRRNLVADIKVAYYQRISSHAQADENIPGTRMHHKLSSLDIALRTIMNKRGQVGGRVRCERYHRGVGQPDHVASRTPEHDTGLAATIHLCDARARGATGLAAPDLPSGPRRRASANS